MSKRFQCWLGNTKLSLPFPMIFRMTGNVSCKSFCCYSLAPLPDATETPSLSNTFHAGYFAIFSLKVL